MKKKIPQPTITEELFTRNWIKAIGFEKDLQGAISNENVRNKAMGWLFEWAPKPESETLYDFCAEYCIPRSTLYYWAAHDPVFRRALDEAKLIIANKLYKGSLKKVYDRETAFKSMHKLDDEYLEINAYHASLNQKSNTPDYELMQKAVESVMGKLEPVKESNGTKND